ncbi:MAG: D-aminoacyl-tRNA deacylase [Ignavibacteriales bacterium]|nr:D-aminoacyl-tRNA deacylase [Ignavibacteriales bacterium]
MKKKITVQKLERESLYYLGIKSDDNENDLNICCRQMQQPSNFSQRDASAEDENEKMNLSLKDINGEVLIISQFTLYGDAQKGNRPSFIEAAKPEIAIPLYEKFISRMKSNLGEEKIKTGIFGAMMQVKIINDGPVTILVESKPQVNK